MISLIIIWCVGGAHYHIKNGPTILISIIMYNVYVFGLGVLYSFHYKGQKMIFQFDEIDYK